MGHEGEIWAYLRSLAPARATNAEIGDALGIASYSKIYRITRSLREKGLIHGERTGRAWRFGIPQLPAPTRRIPQGFSWTDNRSAASWQVHLLAPLLAQPRGRTWFLRRLRCPCTDDEARAAEVYHFVRPLDDLFSADYQRARSDADALEAFIAYYNDIFGLPADCGIGGVWHKGRKRKLRRPLVKGKRQWTRKLLKKHIPDKRYRRRARRVPDVLAAETDLLLITSRHVILVEVLYDGPLKERSYFRHKALAGALEHRLRRMYYLAAVVGKREQLGVASIPYLTWADLHRHLQTEAERREGKET